MDDDDFGACHSARCCGKHLYVWADSRSPLRRTGGEVEPRGMLTLARMQVMTWSSRRLP